MPTDIHYDSDFQTEWTARGDLRTVTDRDIDGETTAAQIHQSVVTSVIERTGLSAPGLAPTDIEERRGDIERAVRSNDQTEPPVRVFVEDIDYENRRITYRVTTDRVSVPIVTE